ncbi:MAG: glycosyltransferase family 2 protein [Thermoleophilia bacterium]
MPRPLVTIGVPVFDGEAYLEAALDSVLGQTWGELEVVISDNASTDGTEDICRAYAARDPRVRYVRNERNLGAAPNYNALVGMARGGLFRWASHDDALAPDLVERCVAALRAAPAGTVLAFAEARTIDERGEPTGLPVTAPWRGGSPHERLAELLLGRDSYIVNCAPVFGVIRTEALRRTRLIGGYESSDKVLLVELALAGEMARVPDPLFLRRRHAGSSREANVTPEERARWFDEASAGRAPLPRTRVARGVAGAVARAPLGVTERARCAAVVARWLATERRWRVIAGECRAEAARRVAGRPRAGAAPS